MLCCLSAEQLNPGKFVTFFELRLIFEVNTLDNDAFQEVLNIKLRNFSHPAQNLNFMGSNTSYLFCFLVIRDMLENQLVSIDSRINYVEKKMYGK